MFLMRKKTYVLDCFTSSEIAFNLAKINYSKLYFPEWWKKTKKTTSNNIDTIKSCTGFIEYFKTGIVIPSWFEIKIDVKQTNNENETFSWIVSNKDVQLSRHDSSQFYNFAKRNGRSLKILSPWHFSMKEDIKFAWTQPTWHMRDTLGSFTVLPAVVDYKYQNATNINLFVEAEEIEKTFIIPALTPLVMLHPLTENKIEIKNHLLTEKEYNKKFMIKGLYLDNVEGQYKRNDTEYSIRKKIIDKLEDIKKCPFHND